MSADLPGLSLSSRDSGWADNRPDPLASPLLYDGILWRRSFAYLTDVALLVCLNVLAHVVLFVAGILSFGLLLPLLWVVAFVPVAVTYDTLLAGGARAATPGMRLFDVELRTWTGERPSYLHAFLWSAIFYTTIGLTGFLILIVALFTPCNRTVHDLLSGTVAIRRTPAPI